MKKVLFILIVCLLCGNLYSYSYEEYYSNKNFKYTDSIIDVEYVQDTVRINKVLYYEVILKGYGEVFNRFKKNRCNKLYLAKHIAVPIYKIFDVKIDNMEILSIYKNKTYELSKFINSLDFYKMNDYEYNSYLRIYIPYKKEVFLGLSWYCNPDKHKKLIEESIKLHTDFKKKTLALKNKITNDSINKLCLNYIDESYNLIQKYTVGKTAYEKVYITAYILKKFFYYKNDETFPDTEPGMIIYDYLVCYSYSYIMSLYLDKFTKDGVIQGNEYIYSHVVYDSGRVTRGKLSLHTNIVNISNHHLRHVYNILFINGRVIVLDISGTHIKYGFMDNYNLSDKRTQYDIKHIKEKYNKIDLKFY